MTVDADDFVTIAACAAELSVTTIIKLTLQKLSN